MNLPAIMLIVLGAVYLAKPDIFKRGIWVKTSIAQRTLSPTNYVRYMRGLGVVFIIIGLALIITGR
jgi:hypothetical protein